MADRSVDIDPPQYIPVSNDSEDCSLEPKACPEPSHACPDARAYPQRRPGSLRRTRFPGGDTGGHLRTGRIEPGGRTTPISGPRRSCFSPSTIGRSNGWNGISRSRLRRPCPDRDPRRRTSSGRSSPTTPSTAVGICCRRISVCTPYETLRWRAITPRGRIASSRLSKRLSAVSGGESSRAAPTRLPASLASFWRSTKAPCSSAYWNRPQ